MIYTSEQSIKNNKGSFDCFSWGKRIESSVSYRHEIIFQQTNDAGFCAGLSEHNKYRIPLIFFSLIFPQLMPFALTCNILYQGRNFFLRGWRFLSVVEHIYLEYTLEEIFEIQNKANLRKEKIMNTDLTRGKFSTVLFLSVYILVTKQKFEKMLNLKKENRGKCHFSFNIVLFIV